jgi:hypothetical protein
VELAESLAGRGLVVVAQTTHELLRHVQTALSAADAARKERAVSPLVGEITTLLRGIPERKKT